MEGLGSESVCKLSPLRVDTGSEGEKGGNSLRFVVSHLATGDKTLLHHYDLEVKSQLLERRRTFFRRP